MAGSKTFSYVVPDDDAVVWYDDDAVVWYDDEEVWRFDGSRGVEPDSDIVPVTLEAGETQILVRMDNLTDQWGLFMRFTGRDGGPVEGVGFEPVAEGAR